MISINFKCERYKSQFIELLEEKGILRDEPRISEIINAIQKFHGTVEKKNFVNCIAKNISIIEKAFSNEFIIHNFEEFTEDIREIYNKCLDENGGDIATYIPQLAKQDPEHLGTSIKLQHLQLKLYLLQTNQVNPEKPCEHLQNEYIQLH